MPSMIIPGVGLAGASGGVNIMSGVGVMWSGQGAFHPVGGVQLLADPTNPGPLYYALSGNITITSGIAAGANNSGGMMDGFPLAPGGAAFVPKLAFIPWSGNPRIFFAAPANSSGGRVYWDAY